MATGSPTADLLHQALAQYPGLARAANTSFVQQPRNAGQGAMLEMYPPGETDSPTPSRPTLIAYGHTATPTDAAGDLVSHYLARGADPALTRNYGQFVKSLTPQQHQILQGQYAWSRLHGGETRPYAEWAKVSGIPAYYRGYAFSQWGPANGGAPPYTVGQIGLANQMLGYLQTGRPQSVPADAVRTALQTSLAK